MSLTQASESAKEILEEKFGSLEEFAYKIVEQFPQFMEGDYSLGAIAETFDVDYHVVSRIITSPAFSGTVRRMLTLRQYNFLDEMKHIDIMRKMATNDTAAISNVIAAREHIARLQGDDLNPKNTQVVLPVQVNFQMLAVETPKGDEYGYKPAAAGDLPPPGVQRSRKDAQIHDQKIINGVPVGGQFDFYSGESPYIAEKTVTIEPDENS